MEENMSIFLNREQELEYQSSFYPEGKMKPGNQEERFIVLRAQGISINELMIVLCLTEDRAKKLESRHLTSIQIHRSYIVRNMLDEILLFSSYNNRIENELEDLVVKNPPNDPIAHEISKENIICLIKSCKRLIDMGMNNAGKKERMKFQKIYPDLKRLYEL
jgi:hypothetical protein